MSLAAASPKRSESASASALVADTASGYHVLRVDGYSRTKDTPNGENLKSLPFTVGGRRWNILYYPNGYTSEDADYISVYLRLVDCAGKPVKAQLKFNFLRDALEHSLILGPMHSFDSQSWWGQRKFIKREDLEKSKHLQDDSFAIRCDVRVFREFLAKDDDIPEDTAPTFVSVTPSDLHQRLGDLLRTEKGADVVFDVGGQTFAAHRCVLAARSPVFSAELYGTMKEGDTRCVVRVDDMESWVFKALLRFIYTDMFPDANKEGEEEDVLSLHLLLAADRYNLKRLKELCEEKLCKYIDINTVDNILTLAGLDHCPGLKKACFHFLSTSANLKAVMASNGFEHLSTTCPSVMKELMTMISNLIP